MDRSVERFLHLPTAEPRIETCWAMVGPSRRPLTCAIYQTDLGLEVRVGYANVMTLCSRRAKEMDVARTTARALRRALNVEGVFEDLYEA